MGGIHTYLDAPWYVGAGYGWWLTIRKPWSSLVGDIHWLKCQTNLVIDTRELSLKLYLQTQQHTSWANISIHLFQLKSSILILAIIPSPCFDCLIGFRDIGVIFKALFIVFKILKVIFINLNMAVKLYLCIYYCGTKTFLGSSA